jgi:hypothetical protein
MNSQPSTLNPQPSVQLHIERLVVDQSLSSPGRGDQLQAAIETELARLLSERGLSELTEAAIPNVAARDIRMRGKQVRPASLGHQIAQAIYGSLTPVTASPRETRLPEGPNG